MLTLAWTLCRVNGELEVLLREGWLRMSQESKATGLVRIAMNAGAELWSSTAGDPYMTVPVGAHRENYPLKTRRARQWLRRLYFQRTGQAVSDLVVREAVAVLSAQAESDGVEHPVAVRRAECDGVVYLALADKEWSVIEITAAGWRTTQDGPVRFWRPDGLKALPMPRTGGSFDVLRLHLHLRSDADWQLAVAWLIGCMSSGPYPMALVTGEQDSGKTTAALRLRDLIDPIEAPLRAEPASMRDLMIAADHCHILAFDNLSRIPARLSDALCRLATGGGLSVRTLYTDDEERIFSAMRPVIVNGIGGLINRADLLDRAMVIECSPIADDKRRPTEELNAEFARIHPFVLGAVLDAVSAALRNKAELRLPSLPRMADFGRFIAAAEPALGFAEGTLLAAYQQNREEVIEAAIDGDPVAFGIQQLLNDQPEWTGRSTDLLEALDARVPGYLRQGGDWPKNAKAVAETVKRLAPALRRIGIAWTPAKRQGHRRDWIMKLRRVDGDAVRTVRTDRTFDGATKAGQSTERVGRATARTDARPPGAADADGADKVVRFPL
jgi:hypothetical protein